MTCISLCETVVVWNLGCTKSVWFYRCVVNTDCFKNTRASNAPVTLVTHISSVHWREVSEKIKIVHIKKILEKMRPHPKTTGRITQTFHKSMWQKKNTKPRWSANWIKITNVQFLEWVKQLMMLKLYRSSKADGQHMERLERSLQMCVSASPSGTGAITQNQRESWKLPRSPVTPFIQATYLSPLSSCTALKTPLASPTESS